MDVIALNSAGFTNAVAGLGTALTPAQVSLISRYAKEVMICYDSDTAGKQATAKAISLFSQTGVKVRVIDLPEGKDPDDIIKQQGKESFRSLLDVSANDIEYRLSLERKNHNLQTADGKISFLKSAAVILALNGGSIERDIYAAKLSDELDVDKSAVLQQIKLVDVRNERARQKGSMRQAGMEMKKLFKDLLPQGHEDLRIIKAQEILLANIITNPSFLTKLEGRMSKEIFITPVYQKAFGIISERILNNNGLDIIYLTGEFTPDEMGAVSRLYAATIPISNTLKECEDCITVLLEETKKSEFKDVSKLTDEEFKNLFIMDKNQQ